jgi:hypothetical protein
MDALTIKAFQDKLNSLHGLRGLLGEIAKDKRLSLPKYIAIMPIIDSCCNLIISVLVHLIEELRKQ